MNGLIQIENTWAMWFKVKKISKKIFSDVNY